MVRAHCGKHTTAFFDAHYAMCLAASGDDDGLDELMESMRRYALDSPLFSEAHSTSVRTPEDEDVPIADPSWGWEPWMSRTDDDAKWRSFWDERGMSADATMQPVAPDPTTGQDFDSSSTHVPNPGPGGDQPSGAVAGYSLTESPDKAVPTRAVV